MVAIGSGQGSLLVQSEDLFVSKGKSPTESLTTVYDLLGGARLLYSRDQTIGTPHSSPSGPSGQATR